MTEEHHHHFEILDSGRPTCTLCGLDGPTEGPLSACREVMMGAGGYGLCRLPVGHKGSHLEGSWEMIR